MEYTNNLNLPLPIVSAMQRLFQPRRDRPGRISVTGLVLPPRIRQLEIRHDSEITVDYSELLRPFLGLIVHGILEHSDTTDHLAEEPLKIRRGGWEITGRPDLYTPENSIDDYKVASVWAYLLGGKTDWETQLNLYDLLYREHGFHATKLRDVAMLTDFSARRAETEKDYPPAGFFVKEWEQWPRWRQEEYLRGRLIAHQAAENLPDDELPLCSPEERWHRGEAWALQKKGGKKRRAIKLYKTEREAMEFWERSGSFQSDPKHYEMVHRPGIDVRCTVRTYCRVREWCSYYKGLSAEAKVSDEETAVE